MLINVDQMSDLTIRSPKCNDWFKTGDTHKKHTTSTHHPTNHLLLTPPFQITKTGSVDHIWYLDSC